MPLTFCDVFSSLFRAMCGCFFDCFRLRPDSRHHDSAPSPAEEVTEKIHISSLFAAEEKEECVVKERENLVRRVGRSDIEESLLEEVKLLKACSTLPETPAEIRKAVKFSDQLEKSDTKMRLTTLESSPRTPAAIQTEEIQLETSESANSGRPDNDVTSSPETPEEVHKVEFTDENSEKNVRVPNSMLKASPYPTSRKLTDDMQTPGTVYATNMKSLTKGDTQIRPQYVYTVSNPVDSKCQLEGLKEEHSDVHLSSVNEGENLFQSGEATLLHVGSSEKSVNEETLGDASLSSWLKPIEEISGDTSTKKPNARKSSGDRHIIGLVAAHWNEQEDTPHVQPKWWDGNGIPNSTTKYKEDQKVCWHATPFEERLEKALSEETFVPQRKPISGAPIIFEDMEGQDTATSPIKTTPKSVVTF